MKLWPLLFKEIGHRNGHFALCVLMVLVAAAAPVGLCIGLKQHDQQTARIVAQKAERTRLAMEQLEDDYRKITKGLGFNILIMPKEQDLSDFYAADALSHYMPEEYAATLAASKIITVQHLLPSLQEKVYWPEQKRTIVLVGARGEVAPSTSAEGVKLKPMLSPVAPDTVVLGHELAKVIGTQVGQTIDLLGLSLKVAKINDERGSKDDVTAWIDLAQAQKLLNKPGLINGILALECQCAWADLPKVREEISRVLPQTQVIEFRSNALVRAETRQRAAKAKTQALQDEIDHRTLLRQEQEELIALVTPAGLLACAAVVGLLTLLNVRERRGEIGLLRALGVSGGKILRLFLAKALLVGLLGAGLGVAAGMAWAALFYHDETAPLPTLDMPILIAVLLGAPLLTMVASWIPALWASWQDPAQILRESS